MELFKSLDPDGISRKEPNVLDCGKAEEPSTGFTIGKEGHRVANYLLHHDPRHHNRKNKVWDTPEAMELLYEALLCLASAHVP